MNQNSSGQNGAEHFDIADDEDCISGPSKEQREDGSDAQGTKATKDLNGFVDGPEVGPKPTSPGCELHEVQPGGAYGHEVGPKQIFHGDDAEEEVQEEPSKRAKKDAATSELNEVRDGPEIGKASLRVEGRSIEQSEATSKTHEGNEGGNIDGEPNQRAAMESHCDTAAISSLPTLARLRRNERNSSADGTTFARDSKKEAEKDDEAHDLIGGVKANSAEVKPNTDERVEQGNFKDDFEF